MALKSSVINPLDAKVVELNDEALQEIVNLRKQIKKPEEREGFVCGLYYIAIADEDYSIAEKTLVEGTACALGIGSDQLDEIFATDTESEEFIKRFSAIGNNRYKQNLFEEMARLTYLKGFQLATEDEALKKAAKAMGIPEGKTENILSELYLQSQGYDTDSSVIQGIPKAVLGVGAVAAGAVVCAVTAGIAAPAIGAAVGSAMGLSGAAAANAGLALLGGGAIAVGGAGMAGGTAAVVGAGAIMGGAGGALVWNVKENISNALDKKKLAAFVRKQQKGSMTNQAIIKNLMEWSERLKERLARLEEAHASKRDINNTKLEIANLEAQKAELELAESS